MAIFEGMNIRNSLCATHQRTCACVGLASSENTYVTAVAKLCCPAALSFGPRGGSQQSAISIALSPEKGSE